MGGEGVSPWQKMADMEKIATTFFCWENVLHRCDPQKCEELT
jgi:hypothetical protein